MTQSAVIIPIATACVTKSVGNNYQGNPSSVMALRQIDKLINASIIVVTDENSPVAFFSVVVGRRKLYNTDGLWTISAVGIKVLFF